MPQSTPERRARWGISEAKAIEHLESRGYTLTPDFRWRAPTDPPTEEDIDAILFLIEEWDFGPIANEEG